MALEEGTQGGYWRLKRQIDFWCLIVAVVTSAIWLFSGILQCDEGILFRQSNISAHTMGNVVGTFIVFWGGWSYTWYRLNVCS